MAAALADRLLDAALALFASRNTEMTPACRERLRALVEEGARTLTERNAGEEDIRKAEVRMEDFAIRMTDEAMFTGEAVLSEQAFVAAHEFLGPIC